MAGGCVLVGAGSGVEYSEHGFSAPRIEKAEINDGLVSCRGLSLLLILYLLCSVFVGSCRKLPRLC
ncbi:hypothetical protein D3C85_628920 [compost metagenome]